MALRQKTLRALNGQFLMNGLDEIIVRNEPSSLCESLVQCSINLPKIPKEFGHLYEGLDTKPYELLYAPIGVCNCYGDEEPYAECPHLQDPSFMAIIQILPKRLAHLDQVNPVCKQSIREQLFNQVIHAFEHLPCQVCYPQANERRLTDDKTQLVLHEQQDAPDHLCVKDECHLLLDLKKMFPAEYDNYYSGFDPRQSPVISHKGGNRQHIADNRVRAVLLANGLLNLLFVCALVYCVTVTRSSATLCLLLDAVCMYFYQMLQLVASRVSAHGELSSQEILHYWTQNSFYSIYNYSSLGILVIGCTVVALCMVLIGNIISTIIDNVYTFFTLNVYAAGVVGALIAFRLVFLIVFRIIVVNSGKVYTEYANILFQISCGGAISAALTLVVLLVNDISNKLADPIAGILICIYLLLAHGRFAIREMQELAGHPLAKSVLDQYMMMLLHQFTCSVFIQQVDGLIGYTSGGDKEILEINITVPESISVNGVHSIVQTIQSGFEKLAEIEKCHVHVECHNCVNDFDAETTTQANA